MTKLSRPITLLCAALALTACQKQSESKTTESSKDNTAKPAKPSKDNATTTTTTTTTTKAEPSFLGYQLDMTVGEVRTHAKSAGVVTKNWSGPAMSSGTVWATGTIAGEAATVGWKFDRARLVKLTVELTYKKPVKLVAAKIYKNVVTSVGRPSKCRDGNQCQWRLGLIHVVMNAETSHPKGQRKPSHTVRLQVQESSPRTLTATQKSRWLAARKAELKAHVEAGVKRARAFLKKLNKDPARADCLMKVWATNPNHAGHAVDCANLAKDEKFLSQCLNACDPPTGSQLRK